VSIEVSFFCWPVFVAENIGGQLISSWYRQDPSVLTVRVC
jgi:hypothetical protein